MQVDYHGNQKDKVLKPDKLAAFYKAVGGDYDSKKTVYLVVTLF